MKIGCPMEEKLNPITKEIIGSENLITKRSSKVSCLYYDTEDRKFYLDHHNQRVNRNKIRFREYEGSNLTFLEIKLNYIYTH